MQRFVTAVFSHETNTFSSIPTPLEAFGRFSGGKGPVQGTRQWPPTEAPILQ